MIRAYRDGIKLMAFGSERLVKTVVNLDPDGFSFHGPKKSKKSK